MLIRGIMGTDCIHVHFFNQQSILQTKLPISGTSPVGMETMPVCSLHNNFCPVDINTIFRTELNSTKSNTLFVYMNRITMNIKQFQLQHIKIRMLTIPSADTLPLSGNILYLFIFQRNNLPAQTLLTIYRRKGSSY